MSDVDEPSFVGFMLAKSYDVLGIWSTGPGASKIGEVASGTQSPSLGIGIGMGYVPPQFAKAGTPIEIEIRGRRAPAILVPKPIYRKPD